MDADELMPMENYILKRVLTHYTDENLTLFRWESSEFLVTTNLP